MVTPSQSAGGGRNWPVLILILVTLLIFLGIGVAAYLNQEPELDTPAQIEISKRERQISRLQKEIAFLTAELLRVRTDYAQLVAERRCEVIDGMDDCLAAGLTRPERFRESDAELLRQREEEKARKPAIVEKAEAGKTPPAQEKTTRKRLTELLNSLPGVHVE